MLHQLHQNAHADRMLCNDSADTGSIVDRLLAVAELPETENEIDRAIAQHRQLTLARTIRNLIERDDHRGCEAA
ncbi:hypothetical protein PZ895_19085 [Mesorhizobium sp. YIM 152430]|uniref:hypothetical protein n=1 Tax=Mesorhizobium sp. YIM 152430 TaxID=3031761 RepID=UPI0023DB0BBD|nr:hypothetical protein [Mesorhizobium sp. YIM 152430]MDF1601869.1 hypothetical protein [Mesorhizobium sp. YIM 152430]